MQADSWLVILILLHACIGKYSCRQFTLWKKLKFSSFLSCLLKLLMLTPVCTFKQKWLSVDLSRGLLHIFHSRVSHPGTQIYYFATHVMQGLCRSLLLFLCLLTFADHTYSFLLSAAVEKLTLLCGFLLGVVCPLRREPQPVGKTLTNGWCNAPEFGILPLC